MNLFKRQVSNKILCPICELEEEALTHTLVECPIANDVWGEGVSPLKKWAAKALNIRDLWTVIIEAMPPNTQVLVATIFWNLWLQRNVSYLKKSSQAPLL